MRSVLDVAIPATAILVITVVGLDLTRADLARAATALSVSLRTVSCVAAVVTMPLLTRGFELALGRPVGYRAPVGPLAAQVLAMLVLPVALGMTVRARAPGFAARHERTFARTAACGLALLLGFILVSEWDRFVTNLAATYFFTEAALVGVAIVAFRRRRVTPEAHE